MVTQVAIANAAVEAHPGTRLAVRAGSPQRAGMAEAEMFGPKAMGRLKVADVEDDVI